MSDGRSELVGLIDGVARRETYAFRRLYDRASPRLYAVCLRVLRDEADAQDVLQEVFVTVWKKAATFDSSRAGVMTWLITIARNRSIDRLRTRRPAESLDAASNVAEPGLDSFDVLDELEEAQRLRRCLDQLDEGKRDVIRSAFFSGLSYPQLAGEQGVPLPTLKSRIRRGLLQLRGCLEA